MYGAPCRSPSYLTPMAATSFNKAVNTLLSVIGEAPVSSVDEGHMTAVMAKTTLEETSRAVQMLGWRWNTEPFEVETNAQNEIVLPSNTLSAHFPRHVADDTLVLRNGKLYDLTNRTYQFSAGTKYKTDLVLELPWEELPEEGRRYITIKAARQFGDRIVGDQAMHAYTQQEEYEAKGALWRAETGQQYRTIFDNYDSKKAVWRAFGA